MNLISSIYSKLSILYSEIGRFRGISIKFDLSVSTTNKRWNKAAFGALPNGDPSAYNNPVFVVPTPPTDSAIRLKAGLSKYLNKPI